MTTTVKNRKKRYHGNAFPFMRLKTDEWYIHITLHDNWQRPVLRRLFDIPTRHALSCGYHVLLVTC